MSRKQPELFGTVLEAWRSARSAWWRPATLRRFEGALHHFAPLCRLPVDEIRKSTVEAWLGHLPVAASTRRLLRAHLHAAFNWAIDDGRAEMNPVSRIRLRVPAADRRALTTGEAAEWLRAARERSSHLETVGVFGLYTGLRISNLLALDNSRIRRDRFVFPPEMMKAGQRFELPLHPILVPYLNRLPMRITARQTEFLCSQLEPRIRPHDLRHTFGTWLATVAPWPVVAAALGHTRADNSPTAVYIHIKFESIRDALLRLPRLV